MYSLTKDGKFVIENYNWETSFSNFLPGIAGRFGIPMWVYYVSRNQGIISLGVRDKNHQIMEFLSFNKALELAGIQGFRTFLKIKGKVYEPFIKTDDKSVSQTMTVSSEELVIEEINKKSGITTEVIYFPITNSNYPGFVRQVRFKNNTGKTIKLEFADGLPKILPYGMDIHCVNTIARHVEGMMQTVTLEGAPLFRLKQTAADTEQIGKIEGGNYYLSSVGEKNRKNKINYIVDPSLIFGESEVYTYPWNFKEFPLSSILKQPQVMQNKTPSAMTCGEFSLKPGGEFTLNTVIGYAKTDKIFKNIIKDTKKKDFFARKREENIKLIQDIKDNSKTISADIKFDRFCEQNFLDNVIRGGMPAVYPTASDKTAFYLYSRQNGDLERDYHFFIV
ncbi:MAG: hypothetical protein ABIH00_12125, partial [Armatimonadota bacterium]